MKTDLDVDLLHELIRLGERAAMFAEGAAAELMLADLRAATPVVVGPKLCRIADDVRWNDLAVTIESPTVVDFPAGRSWWEWQVGGAPGSVLADLAPYDRVGMLVVADATGKIGTIQPVLRDPDNRVRLELWPLAIAFDLRANAAPVRSLLPMVKARAVPGYTRWAGQGTPAEDDAQPEVTARFGQHFGVVPSPYHPREAWSPGRSPQGGMTIHQMPAEVLVMLCLMMSRQLVPTTTTATEHCSVLEAA